MHPMGYLFTQGSPLRERFQCNKGGLWCSLTMGSYEDLVGHHMVLVLQLLISQPLQSLPSCFAALLVAHRAVPQGAFFPKQVCSRGPPTLVEQT